MIDTDKYEGHTEGRWEYYYDPNCDDWILKTSRYIHSGKGVRMKKDSVDAQLIADAPLLLEEVKRLREQYTELREALVGDSPNWTHEELIEKALELIDNE